MPVNFDEYGYYPALRTRMWELKGYRVLASSEKSRLLPIVTLTRHSQVGTCSAVAQVAAQVLEDHPFILDLETSPLLACADAQQFVEAANGFRAWRDFVSSHSLAIPLALLPQSASLRDIVRQVLELEQLGRGVVVRSRSPAADVQRLTAILSAVNNVESLLIVLDFGYIRSRVTAASVEAANVINALRNVDGATRVVVMGSSYPKSAAAYDDSGATLEIEERTLHSAIGGDTVAIYGDHASIHPEPFEPMQSRFVPRVDYATSDSWIFRRVRADQGGFQECARRIVSLMDWDPSLINHHVWGAERILAAAQGDITRMGTPVLGLRFG